jgi:hypothetical protein
MGKTVKGPGWMVNREGLKGEKHQNMFKEKQNGHAPKKPNHPLQSFCIRLDDAERIVGCNPIGGRNKATGAS